MTTQAPGHDAASHSRRSAIALQTDGERWAQEILRELRRARWRPAAWARLLAESFDRARHTSLARPGLSRQARRWSLLGAGSATGLATLASERGLRGWQPVGACGWALGCGAMLEWHIGMVEAPEERCARTGEDRLGLADALTYARLVCAPVMLASHGSRSRFLGLLAGGAVTDVLDGPLARARGATRLGGTLDPAADVAFIAAAAMAAGRSEWLSGPAVAAVCAREASLFLGSAVYYITRAEGPPAQAAGVTRFAGPPLVLGLALAAVGRRRLASSVVIAAAGVASARQLVALTISARAV
jgi:phosphatidylglycerophosphate synthase